MQLKTWNIEIRRNSGKYLLVIGTIVFKNGYSFFFFRLWQAIVANEAEDFK